jgi:hypothetical protein
MDEMERLNDNDAALHGRFFKLFAPGETGHGYYTLIGDGVRDECNTEGKLDKATKGFAHEPVTVVLWELHLAGKQGLGIVPIRKDGTVMWGAIDIDVYSGLDHVEIARALLKLNLPLIVCKSKSGGCHIYLFCSEPVGATAMQNKLREVAAMLGHGKAEVFPKQTKLVDMGSWINMPYFGGAETTRYAVTPDGEALTPEQFLDLAKQSAQPLAFFVGDEHMKSSGNKGSKDPFIILNTPDDGPLSDAPPCLQHLLLTKVPKGQTNNTFVDLAVYLKKAKSYSWERDLEAFNTPEFCEDPLPYEEISNIKKSAKKTDYRYRCPEAHLKPYCNWALCVTRPYGLPNPTKGLGQLVKHESHNPTYTWSYEGKEVSGLTWDDILPYQRFKRIIGLRLNKLLPSMKQDNWEVVLSGHLQDIRTEKATDSDEDVLWQHLEQLCLSCINHQGESREALKEVFSGHLVTLDKRTYFRMTDLAEYATKRMFPERSPQKLADLIRHRPGVKNEGVVNVFGRTVRLWSVPEFQQFDGQLPLLRLEVKEPEQWKAPEDIRQQSLIH